MYYLILAAGNGSRMGEIGAKPLVTLAGQTLAERMLRIIGERDDVEGVVAVTNSRLPEIETHLRQLDLPFQLRVIPAATPSAAHSLALGLEAVPRSSRFVALTVDTVFSPAEFHSYVTALTGLQGPDGLMAVTAHIDDEEPMYVETDPDMRITAFGDFPRPDSHYVSAGIYGLGPSARPVIERAIAVGANGLRELQRSLLLGGLDLRAANIGLVLDVDRPHDLDQARRHFTQPHP